MCIRDSCWVARRAPARLPTRRLYRGRDGVLCKAFVHRAEFERELEFMLRVSGLAHFPTLRGVSVADCIIRMDDCGEHLNNANCPTDWREQLEQITDALQHLGIAHNDVWAENLLVDGDGVITLIDYGWATQDDGDRHAPCMNLSHAMIQESASVDDLLAAIWTQRCEPKSD